MEGFKTIHTAKEYIESTAKVLEKHMSTLSEPKYPKKYKNMYHFILENGVQMDGGADGPKIGKAGQCFFNAKEMVRTNSHLHYYEGFALNSVGVPVQHAWVADDALKVVDPTWGEGRDYFGVKFSLMYLNHIAILREVWGSVIDAWEVNWPLLNGEHVYNKGTGEVTW